MTKSRRILLDPRQSVELYFTAPQSAARSAGSKRHFKFEKRPQFFIRTQNLTLAAIRCDYWSALFAQQVGTNRSFQFQKRSQLIICVHDEALAVVADL